MIPSLQRRPRKRSTRFRLLKRRRRRMQRGALLPATLLVLLGLWLYDPDTLTQTAARMDQSSANSVLPRQLTVIDGDTEGLFGRSVRLVGLDTPETYKARCPEERRLGDTATNRLRDLLARASSAQLVYLPERDRMPLAQCPRCRRYHGRGGVRPPLFRRATRIMVLSGSSEGVLRLARRAATNMHRCQRGTEEQSSLPQCSRQSAGRRRIRSQKSEGHCLHRRSGFRSQPPCGLCLCRCNTSSRPRSVFDLISTNSTCGIILKVVPSGNKQTALDPLPKGPVLTACISPPRSMQARGDR